MVSIRHFVSLNHRRRRTSMLEIYFYTLEIALFSTLLAALLGIPLAYFTARRQFFGRRLLLSFSAVSLCVPSLIVALGYVSFWGMNGTVNRALGTHFSFLYSSVGIVIAQGFYNVPFVAGIVSEAWERLPLEQENAARLLGAGESRVLRTVTLHQLSGAIGAACIPVFLFCYFSFMIVLLFSPVGRSTLEVEIYHSIRTTLDVGSGAKLALLETLTAFAIVLAYSFVARRSQTSSNGVNYVPLVRQKIGRSLVFFMPLLLLLLIFLIFPLLSVFVNGAGDLPKLLNGASFWKAAINSLWCGLATGTCCTLLGFAYSVAVKLCRRQGSVLLQTIPVLPMAISSVVISWCATLIFHRGNAALLVALQTALYWPIAYRQIQNGINRISYETDAAARLISRGWFDSVVRIYLPACRPVLISAFAYCFAISLGDATMPLVLSIRNFDTLALYTYKLAGAYRFSQACACGGIVAAISMIIFFAGKK